MRHQDRLISLFDDPALLTAPRVPSGEDNARTTGQRSTRTEMRTPGRRTVGRANPSSTYRCRDAQGARTGARQTTKGPPDQVEDRLHVRLPRI